MKIACIGEAMIEVALTGQTGAAQVGFAGDVLNTAIYLRRALPAVHEVAFVSMIGRDSLSDQMATFIAAEGISVAHLSRHPTLVPGLYTIATDACTATLPHCSRCSALILSTYRPSPSPFCLTPPAKRCLMC